MRNLVIHARPAETSFLASLHRTIKNVLASRGHEADDLCAERFDPAIWFDGLSAILRGYFQKVFLPGVTITIDKHGALHPNLQQIRRIAAIGAYGESQKALSAKGDSLRHFVRNNVGGSWRQRVRWNILATTARTSRPSRVGSAS